MINHEKESVIKCKHYVIELKAAIKELHKLKNERKALQGATTDTMHNMINE